PWSDRSPQSAPWFLPLSGLGSLDRSAPAGYHPPGGLLVLTANWKQVRGIAAARLIAPDTFFGYHRLL
ncbi:MAG: hypothetical protein ACRD8A_19835, partial [Candidatus Acidiferrales bacterium]